MMPVESWGFDSRYTERFLLLISSDVTGPIDMSFLGRFSFPYISIKLTTVDGEVRTM